MTTPPLTASRLSALNVALRATAKTNRHAPKHRALRALTFRARSAGVTSTDLVTWLNLHSRLPDVAALAAKPSVLDPIVSEADRHIAWSSSFEGRVEMRSAAARALVAGLLLPVPEYLGASRSMVAKGRRALAVLAPEMLTRAETNGFDSINFSADEMAFRLGVARGTAMAHLEVCRDARWVTSPRARDGAPSRWRLTAMPTRDWRSEALWAYEYLPLAEALDQADTNNPFVDLVLLADHPAFGYGHQVRPRDRKTIRAALGHEMWLMGIAKAVAASPEEVASVAYDLGLAESKIQRISRRWDRFVDEDTTLREALDRHAAATGADQEAAEARTRRDEQIAARLKSRDERRAEKTKIMATTTAAERAAMAAEREAEKARRAAERRQATKHRKKIREVVLPRLLAAHPIPPWAGPARDRDDWLSAICEAVAAAQFPDDAAREYFADRLRAEMTKAAYPEVVATRVGHVAVGLPQPEQTQTTTQENAA